MNDHTSYLSVGSYIVQSNVLRKYDLLCVGSGYGCYIGSQDITNDVTFWYNRLKGTYSWNTPKDVIIFNKKEKEEKRELRLRGFTTEQEAVATKLQGIWRGKKWSINFG